MVDLTDRQSGDEKDEMAVSELIAKTSFPATGARARTLLEWSPMKTHLTHREAMVPDTRSNHS